MSFQNHPRSKKHYRASVGPKSRSKNAILDIKEIVEKYASYSAILIITWIWASTFFGLGFVGFFNIQVVKYFSILDLQYNAFGYVVYIVPFVLFLCVMILQFFQPAPNFEGEIKPLALHFGPSFFKFWRVILFAMIGAVFLLATFWPFIFPDLRDKLPSNSIVRDFVFSDPIFISTASIALVALVFLNPIRKKWRLVNFIFFGGIFAVFSSALFITGDAIASLSFNGSLDCDVITNASGTSAKVMFVGDDFILVKTADKNLFLWRAVKVESIQIRA